MRKVLHAIGELLFATTLLIFAILVFCMPVVGLLISIGITGAISDEYKLNEWPNEYAFIPVLIVTCAVQIAASFAFLYFAVGSK